MPKTEVAASKSAGNDVLRWLTDRQPEMVEQVREIVVRESPTHDKQACDALKIHRQPKAGNHLLVEFAGARGRKPVLLLGHYDTVYDLGTLKTMPWREEKGALAGPGVFDMKCGIAQIMFAPGALTRIHAGLGRIGVSGSRAFSG